MQKCDKMVPRKLGNENFPIFDNFCAQILLQFLNIFEEYLQSSTTLSYPAHFLEQKPEVFIQKQPNTTFFKCNLVKI